MGKRSDYPRWHSKDFWGTLDERAINEAFIKEVRGKQYAEPCCGAGDLVDLLVEVAVCKWESDIEWRGAGREKDALSITKDDLAGLDLIITNPPFTWEMLKPLLDHLPTLKPTWLLLPADSLHTKRMGPYMAKCEKVVSIGRLKWFRDNDPRLWDENAQVFKKNTDPTDNFVWCLFTDKQCNTTFVGRT